MQRAGSGRLSDEGAIRAAARRNPTDGNGREAARCADRAADDRVVVDFAQAHLVQNGALVAKVFHGGSYNPLVDLFKKTFRVVKAIKPKASRDKSAETFLVGIGLKAGGKMASRVA